MEHPSMAGRICLVTGATSGIGRATAEGLARRGARVWLVGRDATRGAAACDVIRTTSGNPQVEFLRADLSSQHEIRELAAELHRRTDRLHVLVNNAGAIFFRRTLTRDGIEATLALDHLAYFQLTLASLDLLTAGAPARVICVSSQAEASGQIDFADLQAERSYQAFRVYAQAKLANLLFCRALARRVADRGIVANAVTPGPVATNFGGGRGVLGRIAPLLFRLIGRPVEYAAATVLSLACDPAYATVTGKAFYGERERTTSPQSYDVAVQERLWQASAALVGADLPPPAP